MKTKILFFVSIILLACFPLYSQNTIFGVGAGNAGNFNTSIGFNAGDMVTSTHGTFVGHMAGKNITIGAQNSFYGSLAGFSTSVTQGNSFFGYASGTNNTGGAFNSFFGKESGFHNTGGSFNSFFGSQAGYRNTSGAQNAFFGSEAGFSNTTGTRNTFFGRSAGHDNDTGVSNTMIGTQAGEFNKNGNENTFVGDGAGRHENGIGNTYLGHHAGHDAVGTSQNVYVGMAVGSNNASGGANTMIGYAAGMNSTGSGNVFIGRLAGLSETGSDILVIDNVPLATPLIYGKFNERRVGINTTTLGSYTLSVNGDAFATGLWVSSDKRFKKNEKVISGALENVRRINGFSYEFNLEDNAGGRNFSRGNQLGFLAQDLQKVFPELVKDDGAGYLAVNYQGMIPVLVEAIKELSDKVQQQSLELDVLRNAGAEKSLAGKSALGKLLQNIPNPAGADTRIGYELSETTSGGTVFIFDMQGKSLASYPVNQRQGEVTIPAGKLAPGLYHYSLIVNGEIVDTKKMIVSK